MVSLLPTSRDMAKPCALRPRQSGFALVALLFVVAITAIGVERALTWASVQAQREAEAELLYIGQQFQRAIKAYYLNPTGTRHELPQSLSDLLYDPRRLHTTRYLRKIYADPLTGQANWGIVRGQLLAAPFGLPTSAVSEGTATKGIVGVYSRSPKTPIRRFRVTGKAPSSFADWHHTISASFEINTEPYSR